MSPKEKKLKGRPPLAPDVVKGAMLVIRLTAAEKWAIERKAKAARLRASEWARGALAAAASEADPV